MRYVSRTMGLLTVMGQSQFNCALSIQGNWVPRIQIGYEQWLQSNRYTYTKTWNTMLRLKLEEGCLSYRALNCYWIWSKKPFNVYETHNFFLPEKFWGLEPTYCTKTRIDLFFPSSFCFHTLVLLTFKCLYIKLKYELYIKMIWKYCMLTNVAVCST